MILYHNNYLDSLTHNNNKLDYSLKKKYIFFTILWLPVYLFRQPAMKWGGGFSSDPPRWWIRSGHRTSLWRLRL